MMLRRALALLLTSLVLSACASIPTSGPIQQGPAVDVDANEQVIRVIARPPQPGMSPQEIVQGFLDASASFEGDHAVARQYLTDSQSSLWRPATRVTVYDGLLGFTPGSATSVRVTVSLYATIDGEGAFRVTTPPRSAPFDFRMQLVDGEWRIADAPEGLLLSRSDVDRSFRSYNIYFFNPTFGSLVPDPRMIPLQETGLATTLVQALVQGPSDWLAPAVRTAIPDGTTLSFGAVPIDGGVARVDLDQLALYTDDATRQAMSAQIVWTLRQVSGVFSVDIRAAGQTLPVSGVASPQPRESWGALNPDAQPFPAAAFVLGGSRAMRMSELVTEPVPGAAGEGNPPLSAIAISQGGAEIAGLDQVGTLWRGNLAVDSRLYPVLDEPGLSGPTFDGAGNIWVLGGDGVPRVATPTGSVSSVTIEGLPAKASVLGLALAPDDARAALIVERGPRRALVLARVEARGGEFILAGLRRTESILSDVRAVGWSSSQSLAVLSAEGASEPLLYVVDISRGAVSNEGAPPDPLTLAAAPGLPILIGTAVNRIYALVGDEWEPRPFGAKPAYPH